MPRVNPPRHVRPTELPLTRRELHDDGGVWVMLALLLLVTVAAFYLFWAKLATSWPFGH